MTGVRMDPDVLAKSGTEHGHQRAYFSELSFLAPAVYKMTFAVPNGGKRDKSVASSLKAEGVKRGVPDIFCAYPYNGKAGLFIEMKRPESKETKRRVGKTSDQQDTWREDLIAAGYEVATCYTWREALDATRRYFCFTA